MNETLILSSNVTSIGIPHFVPDAYLWTAALIRGTGAIMALHIIPSVNLSLISNTTLSALAAKCAEINEMGVPVLLHYCPDMNGNWYSYGIYPLILRSRSTCFY